MTASTIQRAAEARRYQNAERRRAAAILAAVLADCDELEPLDDDLRFAARAAAVINQE